MRRNVIAALCLLACHAPALAPHAPDARSWTLVNGEATATVDEGMSALRLAPHGGNKKGSNIALAVAHGVEFTTGTIEVDLKGNGEAQASFLGVAFGAGAGDGASYEAVYFRPFNFRAGDAPHRAHAVQYIAWPEHTWEALRTATPGVYESAIDPAPDPARWFHARIEVAPATVRVFVDGSAQPCLAVDRLASATKGSVALWVDSQQGAFANLKVAPAR